MKLRQPYIILSAIIAIAAIAVATVLINKHKTTQKENETIASDTIPAFTHDEGNGVYYWKTVLSLDDDERDYIRKNNVERAYVRFFDVVEDSSPLSSEEIIPNATLQINEKLNVRHIVPTVYITDGAIRRMKGSERKWAEKIVERVSNMCSYNEIEKPNEIQLDCDWTASTDSIYFKLCSAVKEFWSEHRERPVVSSTIRLHQLSQTPPPVDYGVLMLYNTGSFKNPKTKNSIISAEDVKPYLKNLASYPLHLDFAYPSYTWNLVFRDNKFLGILRDDVPSFNSRKVGENLYQILRDTVIGSTALHKDDIIRCESSSAEVVAEVKKMIDQKIGDRPHSDILYHLDSKNLKK